MITSDIVLNHNCPTANIVMHKGAKTANVIIYNLAHYANFDNTSLSHAVIKLQTDADILTYVILLGCPPREAEAISMKIQSECRGISTAVIAQPEVNEFTLELGEQVSSRANVKITPARHMSAKLQSTAQISIVPLVVDYDDYLLTDLDNRTLYDMANTLDLA